MYLNLFVKIFELKKKKNRMNKSNILDRKKMGEQIGQPTLLRWFTAESFNISIHVSDWCNDCSTRCLSDCTGQWIIDSGLLAALPHFFFIEESFLQILKVCFFALKPSNDDDNDYDDDDEYEARAWSNAADLIGQHRAPLQLALQPSPLPLQPYKENIANIWMFLCWHFKVALSQSVTTTKGR